MKTLSALNLIIFMVIAGTAVSIWFDFKKWHSWLLSIYSFLSTFFFVFIYTQNINESIKGGVAITFVLIYVGITTRWSRERAKAWLKEHNNRKK